MVLAQGIMYREGVDKTEWLLFLKIPGSFGKLDCRVFAVSERRCCAATGDLLFRRGGAVLIQAYTQILCRYGGRCLGIEGFEVKKMVLCGSNGYERKYYFNERFANLPEAVRRELQVMCVWFTEECGGILTMEFDKDGSLQFIHRTSEYDGYYDEIGADLKIKQYREERRELLEKLELYYHMMFLTK